MANQVVSLAYYASRAKRNGATADVLSAAGTDYHELLPQLADLPQSVVLWNEMYDANDALVPLGEIDVPQTDYLDIVTQLFRGVQFRDVRLAVVAAPVPPPIRAPYFPLYLATIPNDSRTAPAVTASLERVNEVLATRGVAISRANGLIVGRVQSGKTRNYIGLMLKAMDEGWNVILVLTSCNTFLAKQTRDRIVREFGQVGADNPQFVHELDFMTPNHANRLAGAELDNGFVYWGVSMKEVHGLESIRKWLEMPNQPHGSMRVLIVDDESDNASPDSNAGGQGVLDDEAIAERIDGIRHEARFATLADWFESLLQREWPEIGANTHEADVFGEINAVLVGNGSARVKMETVVNGGEYRHLLGMEQFADPPVEGLITAFFHRQGQGEDSFGGFVLLLRSILDIVRGRSAINAALCTLVGPNPQTGEYAYPFQRCAYLGYTATPYANILNEGPGRTPIYAYFIQSLDIPPQYFGAEAIFGLDLAQFLTRMPIVNPITDDEGARILAPLRDGQLTLDASLVGTSTNEQGHLQTLEWTSLKESVAWAFCTAAARRHARRLLAGAANTKVENRWTTMLVNVDHRQPVHAAVKTVLAQYLALRLATDDSRKVFRSECEALWLRETVRFAPEQFERLFNADKAPLVFGRPIGWATPHAVPVGADTIRFSARLHMAFYAMIPTVYLNREDVAILTRWRIRIFEALDAKRIQNGGTLPPYYDAALPGRPEESLRVRFDRLIDELRRADGGRALPDPIHARLGDVAEGFRNRSSGEYMANVHRSANHSRPTLQLLLVCPDGEPMDGVPYVSVSFYWPDHDPTGFFTVAVDENPDFVTMVTRRGFCQTVEDILRRHDFPMQRRELLREVLERLGPRCNENFFAANIANPLAGYEYHKMEGHNAYCINGWTADEETRLGREFADAAIDILRRERRAIASQDLLNRVVAEHPKFRDFFTQHADLDALLTGEVLAANDITVTSRHPITYQHRV